MSSLPQEILIDIISRLPVKSLLRFRCVSKDFRDLISDSHFITRHFNRSPNNNLATFFHGNSTPTLISHPTTLSSNDTRTYKFTPVEPQFRIDGVVGCCNGIVCLRGLVPSSDLLCLCKPVIPDSLCIWNPATGEVKYVPDAPISSPNLIFDIRFPGFGFGYDPRHRDYKVVRIDKFFLEEDFSVSVYSLSTGEWRELGRVSIKERENIFVNGVLVNGAVNWMKSYVGFEYEFILSFDMVLEQFKEIPEHEYGKDDEVFQRKFGELEGCLSVVDSFVKGCHEIWVMKEYGEKQSWTKLFRICDPIADSKVEQIQRNGEVVVWEYPHFRLIIYDPKSGTQRYIELGYWRTFFMGEHFTGGPPTVFSYKESLVSLRAYKGAQGGK